MTTYERLLSVLGDGRWHSKRELDELTVFPEEWLRELRHDGHAVVEDDEGRVFVRLRESLTAQALTAGAALPRPGRRPAWG